MTKIFIAFCLFSTAFAAEKSVYSCGSPTAFVKRFSDKLQEIVENKDFSRSGKLKRIGGEMDKVMSISVFTKHVIGRAYWSAADKTQQELVVKGVHDDLIDDYATMLLDKEGHHPKLKSFRHRDSRFQVVTINYISEHDKTFKVEYAVTCEGQSWKVFDVSVNGVQLSSLQKSQYQPVLKKGGVKGLVEHLSSKTSS